MEVDTGKMDKKKLFLVIGIAIILVVVLFYLIQAIMAPLIFSWLIAYFFAPTVNKIQKICRNRSLSIVMLFIIVVIVIVIFFIVILPSVIDQVDKIKERMPSYQIVAKQYAGKFFAKLKERYPDQYNIIWNKAMILIQQQAPRLVEPLAKFFLKMFSSFINFVISLLNIIVVPVVSFYWLREYNKINERAVLMVPAKYRETFVNIMEEIDGVLSNFLRGQFMVAMFLAIIYIIGLSILKVPMAILIGFVAGLANMVPYLGLVVGVIPASIFSLVEYQSGIHLLWTISVFGIGQILEGTIIGPRIVGEKVRLHPILVIFSVIIGGSLFGFMGMIMAVPLAAICMILMRRAIKRYKETEFYKRSNRIEE